jgi:hypothetical protein
MIKWNSIKEKGLPTLKLIESINGYHKASLLVSCEYMATGCEGIPQKYQEVLWYDAEKQKFDKTYGRVTHWFIVNDPE